MADQTLQDLLNETKYFQNTNLGASPGTYVPPGLNLKWRNLPFSSALGWVHPWMNRTVNLNPGLSGNVAKLETLAHEAAHTSQPSKGLLGTLFDSPEYKQMKVPYSWYDKENDRPPVQEILASLREHEAMAPAGKTWETTDPGKQFMRYFQEKNPQTSYGDMLQTVDRNMFPEYQMMHESPAKIRPLQQQGFLQQLMQMFGR
jgi:hypothetical protein